MTVKQLIKRLEQFDQEKIVILTEPDLVGWDNIGEVIERKNEVIISFDGSRED